MKEKYIDEAVGVYFIFGEYEDGRVTVTDGNKDVFIRLDREIAEQIVEAHDDFRTRLYSIFGIR